jgi:hypothetical protein
MQKSGDLQNHYFFAYFILKISQIVKFWVRKEKKRKEKHAPRLLGTYMNSNNTNNIPIGNQGYAKPKAHEQPVFFWWWISTMF